MIRLSTKLPSKRHTSFSLSLPVFIASPLRSLFCSLSSFLRCPATFNRFSMRFTVRMPSFLTHIIKVISRSPKLKMLRINTKFNITNVHNHFIFRYVTDINYIRRTVRSDNFLAFTFDNSVTRAIFSPIEYPASIGLFSYFLHKTVCQWNRFRASLHKPIILLISDAS